MTRKMTVRLLGLVTCCVLLAVLPVSAAPTQSPGPYQVEDGMISGEGYSLTTVDWLVSGTAVGAGYRLLGLAAPELRGSGCCCTYLPCMMRKH